MLTIKNFNQADQQKIEDVPRSFKLIGFVYCIFFVPSSFLFGLIGLFPKGNGYWKTTLFLLVIFTLVTSFSIIKTWLLYLKDKTNQKKYSGTITVIKKPVKKGNNTIIITDSSELKKVELLSNKILQKVEIGDQLNIEISKYSRTLLKLERNGENLLAGHAQS